MRRPLVYVAAGAVALALLVIARPSVDPTAVPAQQSSNSSVVASKAPVVPVIDLDLDRLQTEGGKLPESERDPFRFRTKPAPPPAAAKVQAPPPAFVPQEPTGPPPPPPIPLKFIGIFTIRGARVAAFSDGQGNTFTAKEGDSVEGRYRLLRVATDSVDLAYLDGRGRQTIRLTGQ
jgi:hypothetical protein